MASVHDSNARDVRYRVVPGHDDGWEVVVEERPGVVTATYCSDWHRVERVCAALDRRLREALAARDHQRSREGGSAGR